jgi:hypothetical protein
MDEFLRKIFFKERDNNDSQIIWRIRNIFTLKFTTHGQKRVSSVLVVSQAASKFKTQVICSGFAFFDHSQTPNFPTPHLIKHPIRSVKFKIRSFNHLHQRFQYFQNFPYHQNLKLFLGPNRIYIICCWITNLKANLNFGLDTIIIMQQKKIKEK